MFLSQRAPDIHNDYRTQVIVPTSTMMYTCANKTGKEAGNMTTATIDNLHGYNRGLKEAYRNVIDYLDIMAAEAIKRRDECGSDTIIDLSVDIAQMAQTAKYHLAQDIALREQDHVSTTT